MRIERATELLVLSPAMPIAEVALACGFSGSAHFCRVFLLRSEADRRLIVKASSPTAPSAQARGAEPLNGEGRALSSDTGQVAIN